MSRKKPSTNILVELWILSILASSVPNFVLAEVNKEILPKNARLKNYGSGWECKAGYRKNGKICDAINVPENAYLKNSSFGKGWKCNWGYREFDNNCVVIILPANAHLDSSGYDWQCDRGFKKNTNSCVKIKIPENGYLSPSTYGKGWECERGFVVKNNSCVTLNVPVNAHIDFSGHNWLCNPPYTKRQNKCELSLRSND